MKQDSDVVSVPACFISNHEGFLGSIKKLIKDFVVTEIDINGQQVNTAAAAHAPQIPQCAFSERTSAGCKQDNNFQETQDAVFSADCSLDVTVPSPGSFDLSMILGQAVSEQLEQFVVSLRDEKEDAEEPGNKELSLGSFTDKYQRANVHRAVRHRFPFLMTVTIQPEIRVREDPDYRELSQLVTEEEAEDFFRFIDAKVRDSSYTFYPDDNKEHRTAVHHFLNRRFGKLVETKSFSDQESTAITVRLRERGRPKKRTAEERKEEEVYTGKRPPLRMSVSGYLAFYYFKMWRKRNNTLIVFQLSLCARRTWRLWRPSATWQRRSGSYRRISPTLGSRIREPSPTSPWWSRRCRLNGSTVFLPWVWDQTPLNTKVLRGIFVSCLFNHCYFSLG